jgi:hypothetical protein
METCRAVFIDLLRSPGIDSQSGGIDFSRSINVYKYGLWTVHFTLTTEPTIIFFKFYFLLLHHLHKDLYSTVYKGTGTLYSTVDDTFVQKSLILECLCS